MVSITDLEFRYAAGEFSLRIPELTIERGSSVAVIGSSGIGKTTLLNLAAGILIPDAGEIKTNGQTVSSMSGSARRDFRIRNIGLVFQEFELLEYLDVLDNILLPYRINSALELTPAVQSRAGTLAENVGIGKMLRRNVKHLSQGERQRVAVCRAVLAEPVLLLCDEPTGNLDPLNTRRVLDILFDYVKTHDATLISVTHERESLDRFDRIVDFEDFQSSQSPAPQTR